MSSDRNSDHPPITLTAEFLPVTYVRWECGGPGCGTVHREAKTEVVRELERGQILHAVCGACGQRFRLRRHGTESIAVPTRRQTKAVLDSMVRRKP